MGGKPQHILVFQPTKMDSSNKAWNTLPSLKKMNRYWFQESRIHSRSRRNHQKFPSPIEPFVESEESRQSRHRWLQFLGVGQHKFCSASSERVAGKFINCLMKGGNQHKAEKILQKCCMYIKMKQDKPSLPFIFQAVHNVKPLIELKNQQSSQSSKRSKPKPVPIPSKRGERLAIQWIIEGAKKRTERTLA